MSREADRVRARLRMCAEPERAEFHRSFFKTGKGQYGEGDRFLGIRVPHIRSVVKEFRGLSPEHSMELLRSSWHEDRLFALLMLADSFERGDDGTRQDIYSLYMDSTGFINSWDLVDLSAPNIPGAWLFTRNRGPLYLLASSGDLWEKRISIVSTLFFIRRDDTADTIRIAELLLNDEHDLIHKAVGWMLREVGKRSTETEERFLRRYCREMPRTMLRYAIERFPEERRQAYLKGEVI